MSNGIYVLVTRGPEYRVKYGTNIEQIYGTFFDNGRWGPNEDAIKKFFDDAPVFNTREDAMKDAVEKSIDTPYLDDGICFIDDFDDYKFPE